MRPLLQHRKLQPSFSGYEERWNCGVEKEGDSLQLRFRSLARIGNRSDDSGLITGFSYCFRDCSGVEHLGIKEHVDTLLVGLRANPVYALQSFQHAFDALFAALTDQLLITGNFESNGLKQMLWMGSVALAPPS